MKYPPNWLTKSYLPWALFFTTLIAIALPAHSLAADTNHLLGQLQQLDAKVELLQKINDRLMQSVYWTLGAFAAIFLALISVNLYVNISANKQEINELRASLENLAKNLVVSAEVEISGKTTSVVQAEIARAKDEIANLTTSAIKTSEVQSAEKTSAIIQLEINKAAENTLNTAKNALLTSQVEINKKFEESEKRVALLSVTVDKTAGKVRELELDVKEVMTFKWKQQGRVGGFSGQIELLEYDVENRRDRLKYRLEEVRDSIKGYMISQKLADQLRACLAKITEKEHDAIKKEIDSMIVIDPEGKKLA
jgi:hypothetical protein